MFIYYIINANKCRAYNSCISVAFDHRIISLNIRLIIRANNKKSSKIKHYDWARLKTNTETRYTFITQVKTKFEALHGKQIISVKTIKYYTKQREINKINRYQKMSDISTKIKSILYNRIRRNKHIKFRIK